MSSSLLTNRAAMTALTTLRAIDTNMEATQNHISTGREINESSDNTAYWAISCSMESDSQTTGVIVKALDLGLSRISQSYKSVQQVRKDLQEVKNLVITAHGMTADNQKNLEGAINQRLDSIKSAIEAGALNGSNLICQNGTDNIDVPASYRRRGDAITVDKISLDPAILQFAGYSDGKADFSEGILKDIFDESDPLFHVGTKEAVSGETKPSFDTTAADFTSTQPYKQADAKTASAGATAEEKKQIKADNAAADKEYAAYIAEYKKIHKNWSKTDGYDSNTHTPDSAMLDYFKKNAGSDNDGRIQSDDIDAIAKRVQGCLDKVMSADSILGAAKSHIQSQTEFVHSLVDNLNKSVGTLVDADMNAESARLSALKVQQQLATQALSIANASTQNLLTLFRQ